MSTAITFVVNFASVVALVVVTASLQLRGEEGPKTGNNGPGFAKRRVGSVDERERIGFIRSRPSSSLGE